MAARKTSWIPCELRPDSFAAIWYFLVSWSTDKKIIFFRRHINDERISLLCQSTYIRWCSWHYLSSLQCVVWLYLLTAKVHVLFSLFHTNIFWTPLLSALRITLHGTPLDSVCLRSHPNRIVNITLYLFYRVFWIFTIYRQQSGFHLQGQQPRIRVTLLSQGYHSFVLHSTSRHVRPNRSTRVLVW